MIIYYIMLYNYKLIKVFKIITGKISIINLYIYINLFKNKFFNNLY
jgi:hypothetical protein